MEEEDRKASPVPSGTHTGLRLRFWVEAVCGAVTGVLAVVTLFWSDWIEAVFGVNPDHGNGSFEWLVVAVQAVITVSLMAVARAEWRPGARRLGVSEG
jgi:tetrahydromethanopterin S-methyltransferase subunit E